MSEGNEHYEIKPMHDYWVIVYRATGSIVHSAKRRCDAVRRFNRCYASYSTVRLESKPKWP